MGLLQYVTPVMQFGIGVLILRESTSFALLCGFALVWIALAILGFDGVRHRGQAARRWPRVGGRARGSASDEDSS